MEPFKTFLRLIALAGAGYALAGCGLVREDIAASNRQGWERFTTTDWGNTFAVASGLSAVNPGPQRREAAADATVCLHPNGTNRIVAQQGIEDSASYRRCAVAPYPTGAAAPGSRLDGR